MLVKRLYAGEDARSHFADVELATEDLSIIGFTSTGVTGPAKDVFFDSLEDRELDLHNRRYAGSSSC
jgi:hypothetical protein